MLVTLFGSWAVGLALLGYSGWGLARLLSPAPLSPYRPLLVPFFGYALCVILAYYLLWAGIPLNTGRWVILPTATVLNALGWWAGRKRLRAPVRWTECLLAVGLALMAGVIAVLPLFTHGVLGPIGNSWDVEFYLPLATYLQRYGYPDLQSAPPNPMISTMVSDPTWARAIGFSYLQGLVDSFGSWESPRTFAPMLGLMRLLAAPAIYLFAREGLRLRTAAAALAAALVALNEMLLWVQYTGFAMHTSSMALVPAALLLTLVALRELNLRASAAAALVVAALATSYHPALLGYGALALGAGLWYLARGPRRGAVLLHGAGILAGAAALTWRVQIEADDAFFDVYEQGASPLGTSGFISLRTLLGLTPLASDEQPAPPPWGAAVAELWPVAINVVLALGLALVALFLCRRRGERGLAMAMLLTSLCYVLGLRYVVGYPYGHMKGLSFVSFVPLALIAGGVDALAGEGRARTWRPAAATLAAVPLLVVTGATAWDSFSLVRSGPALFSREKLQLLDLARLVPPGAPVLMIGSEELRATTAGLAAYALRDHPIVGRVTTGYVTYNNLQPGATAPYALLGPHEDPTTWGFDPRPLWRNSFAALYAGPPRRLAYLQGQPAVYEARQPTALHRTTALRLAMLNRGEYLTANPSLELAVGAMDLAVGQAQGGEQASRSVNLALGVFEATTLTVEGGSVSHSVDLEPGVELVRVPRVAAPTTLVLRSTEPLLLRYAELYPADVTVESTTPPTVVVGASTTTSPSGARIDVRPTPSEHRLRMALEIYEDSVDRDHYGWAVLPLGSATLDLDLASRRLQVNGSDVTMNWAEERRPGRYFASLWVYQGDTLLDRLPLFTFQDDGGEITSVERLATNALFVSLPGPEVAANAQFGDAAELLGTTYVPAEAGRTARLSLWWRAPGPTEPLLVTAQLLGESDHKWAQWDGPLGSEAAASTGWMAGEIVRQDLLLAVDPRTPPGEHRLLLAVYRPDDSRLPLTVDGEPAGDALTLPAVVDD